MHRGADVRAADGAGAVRGREAQRGDGEDRERTHSAIQVDKIKIDYPADMPPEAREFIECLVQKDPNLRPKSHDLLKFRFFAIHLPKGKLKKMQ